MQLLLKYEDPQSDCEEDPLTSSDNTIGRKRRKRYTFSLPIMSLRSFDIEEDQVLFSLKVCLLIL